MEEYVKTFQTEDHNFYEIYSHNGANVTVQSLPIIVESALADQYIKNPIKLESNENYDASDESSDVEETQIEDLLLKNCK